MHTNKCSEMGLVWFVQCIENMIFDPIYVHKTIPYHNTPLIYASLGWPSLVICFSNYAVCWTKCSQLLCIPWASYQIRKIAGCACAGNAGNVFPRRRFQRKPLVSDPGMHHGTCVTHVPWCMSGSLTCGDGENVPGIPGACAPAILRIWQEAHDKYACTLVLHNINKSTKQTNLSDLLAGTDLVILLKIWFKSLIFRPVWPWNFMNDIEKQ